MNKCIHVDHCHLSSSHMSTISIPLLMSPEVIHQSCSISTMSEADVTQVGCPPHEINWISSWNVMLKKYHMSLKTKN